MSANPTKAYDYLRVRVGAHISRSEMAQIIEIISAAIDMPKDRIIDSMGGLHLTDEDYARNASRIDAQIRNMENE